MIILHLMTRALSIDISCQLLSHSSFIRPTLIQRDNGRCNARVVDFTLTAITDVYQA